MDLEAFEEMMQKEQQAKLQSSNGENGKSQNPENGDKKVSGAD